MKSITIAFSLAALVYVVIINTIPTGLFGPRILKASPVDESILEPLKDLPEYSLEELQSRLAMIDDIDGNLVYVSDDERQDNGLLWRYEFNNGRESDFSKKRLKVVVWIYRTSAAAEKRLDWEKSDGILSGDTEYKDVLISNKVIAALWSVFWYRSADALYMYKNPKILITHILIHNMVIKLDEDSNDLNTIGVETNEALRQIVEALKP